MRFGLGVPCMRRTFVANGSGVSRGDRNRNARLARLRALVPLSNAIVGIDLADKKQMVVVCDHDSRVLARKTFRCRAWDLGTALDWAAERATGKGIQRRDGGLRTDRALLASPRPACRGPGDAVRVRAADAVLLGATQRGSDLRQDR